MSFTYHVETLQCGYEGWIIIIADNIKYFNLLVQMTIIYIAMFT